MRGRGDSAQHARPVVYCLVPRDLASRLHDVLRRHFADSSVEVVVERREAERRSPSERRCMALAVAQERRTIQNPTGRRVADLRAPLVAVDAPVLPRRARPHAARLVFVERLEPATQQLEDADTARLVTRSQAGDRDAFALVYMRYFDRVYGYLRLVYRDEHAAEDAAQQVFLRALEGLSGYQRRRAPFRAWLFVIAHNFALNDLAKARRSEPRDGISLGLPEGEMLDSDPFDSLGWISDGELQVFIKRLTLQQRQVLFLRYVVDLPTPEIGKILGQSPDAVRQHHVRAMSFLRERLVAIGRTPQVSRRRLRSDCLPSKAYVLRARRFALLSPP